MFSRGPHPSFYLHSNFLLIAYYLPLLSFLLLSISSIAHCYKSSKRSSSSPLSSTTTFILASPHDAITQEERLSRGNPKRGTWAGYNNVFALSFHWECDGIEVLEDIDALHTILNTVVPSGNRPQTEVLRLSPADRDPGWTLQQNLKSIFDAAAQVGESLVFINYTGHAVVEKEFLQDSRGRLVEKHTTFVTEGANGRKINLDAVITHTTEDAHFDIQSDVVWVLDCCYATNGKREPKTAGRIVEILSATDSETLNPLTSPRSTLTGRLRDEIVTRQREGHQYVEFADLMQTIRAKSQVDRPSHSLRLGVSSVCLPLLSHSLYSHPIYPQDIAPCLRAYFSVSIAERMTKEEVDRFDQWTRCLPPKYAMMLDAAYRTNATRSTLLVIKGAYAVFSKLNGLPGVKLISEVLSTNYR